MSVVWLVDSVKPRGNSWKLKFSTLYQTRIDRMMKSLVNWRYFWSQYNCNLISTSNLGFFFDVTNSMIDAIKILIVCLQNNNPVTSFSSLLHMSFKITESKKMKLSLIQEILPPEIVEKILKLLHFKDIYQFQLVCKRWKEIIDMGNLKKKATGKTSNLQVPFSF